MRIKIIVIGKLREKYFKDMEAEYLKRLSRFHKIEIKELPEECKIDTPSETEIEKALSKEAEKIIASFSRNSYKIALAIEGKNLSSEEFSSLLDNAERSGKTDVDFVIGGSQPITFLIQRSRCSAMREFSS